MRFFPLLVFALTHAVVGNELKLLQPQSADHYLINGGDHMSIPVRYDIDHTGEDNEKSFCFQLWNLATGRSYSENCVELNQRVLNINEIGVGNYQLSAYLSETTADIGGNVDIHPQKIVNFTVIHLAQALPKLSLRKIDDLNDGKQAFQAILDPVSETASITIPIHQQPTIPLSIDVDVCIWLSHSLTGDEIVSPTCFPSSQKSITMRGLNEGHYVVHAGLRLSGSANVQQTQPSSTMSALERSRVIADSLISHEIKVSSFISVYPSLAVIEQSQPLQLLQPRRDIDGVIFSSGVLEYVADAATGKANAEVTVAVLGLKEATALVVACMELSIVSSGVTTPATCLPAGKASFDIYNLRVGKYSAKLTLRPALSTADTLSSTNPMMHNALQQAEQGSTVVVELEVQMLSEFVPTYDWQALRTWHTIPSGLETRLPIGLNNSPRKEARIPEPWRLQSSLPRPPCSAYFLRMDVYRHTTISQIRQAAAKQCSVSTECVQVLGDGAVLNDIDTIESTGLFFKTQKITLNAQCDTSSPTVR